ncbi:hypothetical protein [Thermococcus litoralis]|uniref:hypothetical protein n=1 Tax=Thermococcus litoralis TaxID=2265 RepID=UPI000B35CBDC|nr:hypothetical protein [Thermococcus litoralis]
MGTTFKTRWVKIKSKDAIAYLKSMTTFLHRGEFFEKDEKGEDIYLGKYLVVKHFSADGKHYYGIYELIKDKKTGVEGWNEIALVEHDPTKDTWRYTNKKPRGGRWYNKFAIL